jgi:DNA-binding transcriptional LysR family regulator
MHFDLSDLRIFVHVAEAPSLTQGARRAHLSPAAVSARIKAMEAQLGSRLLYRDNRGVMLTPAGHTVLKHARLIMRQVEFAKDEFARFEGGIRGHLRIFANTTAATVFLPKLLPAFLSDFPEITIDLQERLSRDIIRGVVDGSADMGLIAGAVEVADLEVIHYNTIRLMLAVPRDHAAAHYPSISFARALEFPHISLHAGSTLHDLLEEQAASYEAICRMIAAGVGVAILPETATQLRDLAPHLTAIPLDEPWAVRPRCILVRELDAMPGYARELVERIRQDGS